MKQPLIISNFLSEEDFKPNWLNLFNTKPLKEVSSKIIETLLNKEGI